MLDRRRFLSRSAALAAIAALPEVAFNQALAAQLPPADLFGRDEEAYWTGIRRLFPLPEDMVYLNNGTNGSCPAPVMKAVWDSYQETERMQQEDPEQYPLMGYGPFNQFRQPLADFVGCTLDEIAIVRNATEANAIMANGLDLKPGDEVLMTDQEHPSGRGPWYMRAKRYGIVVKEVKLPVPARNPAEILNAFEAALTPRTRVLFFSHLTTATGVVLPAKELCALARSKNIVSMVDGAQVCGMMPLNIADLGCDMYGSSPHKWLMAPKGSGFLYVRDEVLDRVWSNTTSAGWDQPEIRAARFQQYGSSNVPIVAGMVAAIAFTKQIGLDRIARRHRAMADYLHAEMVKRGAESWTSPDPAMRCAITTVNVPPVKRMELEKWLWAKHKVRIRGGDPHKLRLSTPYYLLKKDVDRFLGLYDEYRTIA